MSISIILVALLISNVETLNLHKSNENILHKSKSTENKHYQSAASTSNGTIVALDYNKLMKTMSKDQFQKAI